MMAHLRVVANRIDIELQRDWATFPTGPELRPRTGYLIFWKVVKQLAYLILKEFLQRQTSPGDAIFKTGRTFIL
jgi:hypothetical protein